MVAMCWVADGDGRRRGDLPTIALENRERYKEGLCMKSELSIWHRIACLSHINRARI